MEIIYPVPEKLPLNKARIIQILNTSFSLANLGIKIELCCALKRGFTIHKLLEYYGITYSSSNLIIKKFPLISYQIKNYLKISWHFPYKLFLLIYILFKNKNSKIILFLRYPKLAYFLLKFKNFINSIFIYEAHEIFSFKNSKYLKIEKKIFENSDIIICITENLRKFIIENFKVSSNKIYVIPDAVKEEWLNIKREKGEFIFYAGSLEDWKGLEILIKAMSYLPQEKLIIAGEGKELGNLKRLTKELKLEERVKFLGHIPHEQVPIYLSRSKLGILSNIEKSNSLFTSPLKLFEYMALGLPIIASDIPPFREILTHGENAYLVEPENPKALAEGMRYLIENPQIAQSLSSKAKQKAMNYTYSIRAKKIKEIIENLLKMNKFF
ncbi:MAG: glycosyltransferase family 4 protein [Candidatus Pacearchaeota archaeon]